MAAIARINGEGDTGGNVENAGGLSNVVPPITDLVSKALNPDKTKADKKAAAAQKQLTVQEEQQKAIKERKALQELRRAEKDKNTGNEQQFDVQESAVYRSYAPSRFKAGRDHPDPVVENATLSATLPPPVTYNLNIPSSIISQGRLSSLQLEAIVYGCQQHAKSARCRRRFRRPRSITLKRRSSLTRSKHDRMATERELRS